MVFRTFCYNFGLLDIDMFSVVKGKRANLKNSMKEKP